MTEANLKELLYNFYALQKQTNLLKYLLKQKSDSAISAQYGRQTFQIEILTNAISILNKYEIFIIKTHIINHNSWAETINIFKDTYGLANTPSERTFKRIQSRALKKMILFLDSSFSNCFTNL